MDSYTGSSYSKPVKARVFSGRPTQKPHRRPETLENSKRSEVKFERDNGACDVQNSKVEGRRFEGLGVGEVRTDSYEDLGKWGRGVSGNRSVPTKEFDYGSQPGKFTAKYESLGWEGSGRKKGNPVRFKEDCKQGFKSVEVVRESERKTHVIQDNFQYASLQSGRLNGRGQVSNKFFEIQSRSKIIMKICDKKLKLERRTLGRNAVEKRAVKTNIFSFELQNNQKSVSGSNGVLLYSNKLEIQTTNNDYTFGVSKTAPVGGGEKIMAEGVGKVTSEEKRDGWDSADLRKTHQINVRCAQVPGGGQAKSSIQRITNFKIISLRKPQKRGRELGFYRQQTKQYVTSGNRSLGPKSLHYFGPKAAKVRIKPDLSPIPQALALKIRSKNSSESESDQETKQLESQRFKISRKIEEEKSSYSLHADFETSFTSGSFFSKMRSKVRDGGVTSFPAKPSGTQSSRQIEYFPKQFPNSGSKTQMSKDILKSLQKSASHGKEMMRIEEQDTGMLSLCSNQKRNGHSKFGLTSRGGGVSESASLLDRWTANQKAEVPVDPLYHASKSYFVKKQYRKMTSNVPKTLIRLLCKKSPSGSRVFWLYEDERLHVKFPRNVKNKMIDQDMDDDCETDEEHLMLGQRRCILDFKEALKMNILKVEETHRRRAYSVMASNRHRQSKNYVIQRALNNVRAINTFQAKVDRGVSKRSNVQGRNRRGVSRSSNVQVSREAVRETSRVQQSGRFHAVKVKDEYNSLASTKYTSNLKESGSRYYPSQKNRSISPMGMNSTNSFQSRRTGVSRNGYSNLKTKNSEYRNEKNKDHGVSGNNAVKGRWHRIQRNHRGRAHSTIPNHKRDDVRRYFEPKDYRKRNKKGM